MKDERTFLAKVESADVEVLTELLRRPSREEEDLLRVYLGNGRFRRMHDLAVQRSGLRAVKPLGNVVVLPGTMGSELTRIPAGEAGVCSWISLCRLARGEFGRCRLNDDGRTAEYDIRATGILKRYYGEFLLSLAQQWNVRPFWFDWRRDIRLSASLLESQIRAWFDSDEPVHIVAHSMGGLVARAFMMDYPKRWKKMRDGGSKLIMLGTPNYGSFAITQILTGTESTVRLIAKLDLNHRLRDVRAIASSFPACYQMLPSPEAMPSMEILYDPDTWRHLPNVSTRHLREGREFQRWLSEQSDDDRQQMIYIAGYKQPTPDGIPNLEDFQRAEYENTSNTALYHFTADGDGTVPHRLGFLNDGQPMFGDVYYLQEEHGRLPTNPQVISAVDDILRSGGTKVLPTTVPRDIRNHESHESGESDENRLKSQWRRIHEPDLSGGAGTRGAENIDAQLAESVDSLLGRVAARARSEKTETLPPPVSADERKLEDLLARSFLFAGELDRRSSGSLTPREAAAEIEIGLVHGRIDSCDYGALHSAGGALVDCLAVGHYIGVRPQNAELALDTAISREVLRQAGEEPPRNLLERDRVLTQYTDRGVLFGQLGQPFFVPDPRRERDGPERLVAVMGMGVPGQFGTPELTVLARELSWTLGQLGKRHLLTVLIGSGTGNLSTDDAVLAWLRGIAQSLSGVNRPAGKRLARVTFIETDARRLQLLDSAIHRVSVALDPGSGASRGRLRVKYCPLDERELSNLLKQARQEQIKQLDREWEPAPPTKDHTPTRIAVQMEGDAYSFGAITTDASIPERTTKIDSRLVDEANERLAAAIDPLEQWQQGCFMERLLIPRDFRSQLSTTSPLVIVLDRTTARLHWELLAQPDLGGRDTTPDLKWDRVPRDGFLATARGLTRQFRTVLAPPPEPPPPPQRVLRMLVVADPAPDAPLPGAEREGMEVADLAESFNSLFAQETKNRVQVERLFGPTEATRQNVLRKLMLEPWDVLHFAGHCFFDKNDPSASGWIFGMKDRIVLSASELNRIDQVPKFVFSNACESGVTPGRSDRRDPRMAPSFAEAFFGRGVANFVCTAWPVGDNAACRFASRLYRGLLGIENPEAPEPMHVAMREARCAILPLGGRSWGAYQHYGNPNFRLFDAETFRS